jgi:serine/threonine protein kinase
VTQQLGKYQLIRKLATGGMAEVFLAKAAGPMGFEKTLVVKRILPHLAEDPAFVEMFLGEAKLAAQLNHPNVVQIFDFGEADGEYFLAMEYIDGPNLRVLIKRARAIALPLPTAICARLIAAACEGLAFAHEFSDPATGQPLGLIHRDISPDNILVSRQGAVKVVDFGIAKAAGQSHKTQSGIIKGKVAYMPPEQIRAKPLDRRVDVYALGVVLYELLTMHKPYEASMDASMMQAILFEELIPAVQYRTELPEALQRILDRALAKDREQRYPDCLAFAADLEEFILSVGKPVTAQQIVQLIAQVAPNTDALMPTPQSGTARGGSGPKVSQTPVHTPAPIHLNNAGTSPATLSSSHSASTIRSGDMVAPDDTEPQSLPTKTVPFTLPEVVATQEEDAPIVVPRSPRWPIVVLGAALLLAGGGVLLWPDSTPTPVAPPEIAQPTPPSTTPPSTTPPSTDPPTEPAETPPSSPVAEAPPPSPAPTPPADPPASSPEPPKVAEVTPPADPQPPPGESTRRPPSGSTRQPGKTSFRPASTRSPVSKPVGRGTLAFRVRPFATVFINGKNQGQTPFDPVELPAGTYSVRFVNEDLKKNVTQTVELKAGETRVIKLNLEE